MEQSQFQLCSAVTCPYNVTENREFLFDEFNVRHKGGKRQDLALSATFSVNIDLAKIPEAFALNRSISVCDFISRSQWGLQMIKNGSSRSPIQTNSIQTKPVVLS